MSSDTSMGIKQSSSLMLAMYVCMYVHLGHPHNTLSYHLRQPEHYGIQKSDTLILHLMLRANDTIISSI